MSGVNILLLGETGVGKTTLVNSLFNYVTYETFADAKKNFIQATPTQFKLTLPNGQTKSVSTGIDRNECYVDGVSSTQAPKAHQLQYNGETISIIDTPGLGDTRGLPYDERNANTVINYLDNKKYLHGICVLLKSTDIRCNASFNFCIQKVLSQLNRDVLSNVVFVFTNTRCNRYKADDAKDSLKAALLDAGSPLIVKDKDIFCLDNEAFRYLAASLQHEKLPEEEEEAYQNSWSKSSLESKRLLDHMLNLPLSHTKIIVTLRDTNMIIASLAQPLIKIMVEHQKSLDKIEEHRKAIENHQGSIEELKTRLQVPVIQYKTTKKTIIDKTSGHRANVGFSLVEFLLGKAKYDYEKAKATHVEMVTEPYEIKQEDASVKADLLEESDKLKQVKKTLEDLQQMQKDFSEEVEIIVDAAVKFIKFLKENQALEIEDYFQDFINASLKEEKRNGGAAGFIANLENLVVEYNRKMGKLSNVTEDEVEGAIYNLLGLKRSSAVFRRIYLEIKNLLN